ncbi:RNase H [Tepiditoga spiralis]|uniref:Ribonuclease H n=1 Tax=Tepiditoga spiralis TaxID=2108365 RepID=A0A7G1G5X6_9BACT|nr:ribonuclease H family protein [Tepiditoga spiralis]BBE30193.1 RNase H [Tepiditoga spiralis]
MNKKIYAVKKGRKTGLFSSWKECEEQTKGYSGAIYKSFTNKEEAEKYLQNSSLNKKTKNVDIKNTIIAYIDGSFNSKTKEYSAGIVMFYNNTKKTFKYKDKDPKFSKMRNVAGEIMASQLIMQYAVKNHVKNLEIYYDYEGIEKWCTDEWKANKTGTKLYKKYYDQIKDKVNIKFIKVQAHTGNKYNEEADKLAKSALGLL